MAQGLYKIGEEIEVTYQVVGTTSGLDDVIMEIYDETGVKDTNDFPDVTMIEIESTGRYKGSFTPDAEGKWRVMVSSVAKKGKMVKDYDVIAYNMDSIGGLMARTGADGDTLKSLSDQLDGITTPDSPPMIG